MQVSTCWTQESNLHDTLYFLERIASVLCKRAGAVGERIYGLVQKRDFQSLLNFEVKYDEVWDVSELIAVRQALALYQKLEPLEVPGPSKEQVALAAWHAAEESCRQTNNLLRSVSTGSVVLLPRDNLILHKARGILANILGRAPSLGALAPRFGPGSTATVKKSRAAIPVKLGEQPSCSLEFLSSGMTSELFCFSPHWLDCHGNGEFMKLDDLDYVYDTVDVVVETGRLEFVPKNAKTYRAIDKQPTMNTLWQSAIGDYMAGLLRRRGIDLKDQSVNKKRACQGSLDGLTATIDLSSASDTISYELVKALLPDDWFSLLRSTRCGVTTHANVAYRLEKFCAMGNGFTFPLESVIFYALCKASLPVDLKNREVTVYGDDIICPTGAYDEICRTLNTFGFTVNTKKSFVAGPFRESCGGDYFKGIDIRPYYQKRLISGETLFSMHNFFFENFDEEICALIRKTIPTPLRLYGPTELGDGHLHSHTWPYKRAKRGWGGVFFDSYARQGSDFLSPYYGDYVSPLYCIYVRGSETLFPGVSDTQGMAFKADGRPLWPKPSSSDAYERRRIYTFARPI